MKKWEMRLWTTCLTMGIWLLCAAPVWAAPGGIIKAAAKTLVGQIILGILTVIFLPVIVYYSVRSRRSVRRTKSDLTLLAQNYPQYEWLGAKDRIMSTFNWVWSAWAQQKMSIASDFTTSWYWQNQQLQLNDWERRGVENVCHVEKIVSITPIFVQHAAQEDGEGSRLVVSIKAKVVDYLQEKDTGKIVQGDKKSGDLETIWTFLWQEGAWRLNLIEASTEEWNYLFAPNQLPEPSATTQKI